MSFFSIVAATSENTVVTEYEPAKRRSEAYQSEAELEKEFIQLLCEQGYEYLPIHSEQELIQNLRIITVCRSSTNMRSARTRAHGMITATM